jgi:predicted RNase H-like HicB family nuclease
MVIAYCPEVPGANGQGRTRDEARASLADAIALILEDGREDGVQVDAEGDIISVTIRGAA